MKIRRNKMSELVERQFPAKALITGLRAIGYSFSTAVADIMDNSISAFATEIKIFSVQNRKDPPDKVGLLFYSLSFPLMITLQPAGRPAAINCFLRSPSTSMSGSSFSLACISSAQAFKR